MNLKEINDLINIRQYVYSSIHNSSIHRDNVNYLNGILILLDNKIINLLSQDDFKEYIDYKNVKKAIEDVVQVTNIKSSLFKQKHNL